MQHSARHPPCTCASAEDMTACCIVRASLLQQMQAPHMQDWSSMPRPGQCNALMLGLALQTKDTQGWQEAPAASSLLPAAAATGSPKKPSIHKQAEAGTLPLHPLSPLRGPGLLSHDSGGVEPSTGSFNTLLKKVSAGTVPNVTYTDSGADFLGEADRAKGGMRVRMKHYFARQQKGLATPGPA